jgi:hypothetical protein
MFKKIFKRNKKEPQSIKEILSAFNSLEKDFKKLSNEFENLKKEKVFSIQKIGMIRFNPFAEVGSDQSFSVALLDGNDCGVVITSLYSRKDNRIYAKPINHGQSSYVLSEEERRAIEQARSSKSEARNLNS